MLLTKTEPPPCALEAAGPAGGQGYTVQAQNSTHPPLPPPNTPQQSRWLAKVGERSCQAPCLCQNWACGVCAYICMGSYICSLCLFWVSVLVPTPGPTLPAKTQIGTKARACGFSP